MEIQANRTGATPGRFQSASTARSSELERSSRLPTREGGISKAPRNRRKRHLSVGKIRTALHAEHRRCRAAFYAFGPPPQFHQSIHVRGDPSATARRECTVLARMRSLPGLPQSGEKLAVGRMLVLRLGPETRCQS